MSKYDEIMENVEFLNFDELQNLREVIVSLINDTKSDFESMGEWD